MKTCFRLTVDGDNDCKVFYKGKLIEQPYTLWFNKFNAGLIKEALNNFSFEGEHEDLSCCRKEFLENLDTFDVWMDFGGNQRIELESYDIPEETDFYDMCPFSKEVIEPSIQEMRDFLATGNK